MSSHNFGPHYWPQDSELWVTGHVLCVTIYSPTCRAIRGWSAIVGQFDFKALRNSLHVSQTRTAETRRAETDRKVGHDFDIISMSLSEHVLVDGSVV
jgi:hypothetical protein